MTNIKAAFFDFDWTLFDHKSKDFVKSAVEAINKIQKQGIKIFISSARSYFSLASLNTFEKFDFDGYVVSNGGACFLKDRVLYAHYLKKEIAKKIIAICDEHKISYLFSTLKDSFIKIYEDNEDADNFYKVFYEGFSDNIKDYDDDEIMVVQVFCKKDKDHLFKDITGVFHNRFFESCIEFSTKEFVKSEGVLAVLNELNLNTDSVCAFGDEVNDIDMFKLVKYGICMGNGNEEAKKHAYYTTTNIDDDGILNGLKFLGLL